MRQPLELEQFINNDYSNRWEDLDDNLARMMTHRLTLPPRLVRMNFLLWEE
jgi:hypothetical protein